MKSSLMNRIKTVLFLVALALAYGIAGQQDYEEAMRQEQESWIQTAEAEKENKP